MLDMHVASDFTRCHARPHISVFFPKIMNLAELQRRIFHQFIKYVYIYIHVYICIYIYIVMHIHVYGEEELLYKFIVIYNKMIN